MPLIILFGTTGAGKTFIGRLLEKEFGYHFYDGDVDLTEEMKTALHSMQPINDAMRHDQVGILFCQSHDRLDQVTDKTVAHGIVYRLHRMQGGFHLLS